MNKVDLISEVAKECCTKTEAEKAVNTMLGTIEKALASGKKVTISGFGTFLVTTRASRRGRNPQTGAEIKIPSMKIARFRAGESLKKAVR